MNSDYLDIGRVVKAQGLRGEIKAVFYPGVPHDLAGIRELLILTDPDPISLAVKKIRVKGVATILALEGVDDRDAAEALVGATIQVGRDLLPPPGADEFFWQALVGLAVFIDSGRELGRVAGIMSAGGGEILAIRDRGREYLVPAHREFVREIDLDGGRITISPPEGLLELYGG